MVDTLIKVVVTGLPSQLKTTQVWYTCILDFLIPEPNLEYLFPGFIKMK